MNNDLNQADAKGVRQRKMTNMEIATFCSQMAMILKTGLPASEGISIMLEDAQNEEEKKLLNTIQDGIISSYYLYSALEETKVFPSYMVRMIEIGETTGNLDDVMEALSLHYEREENLLQNIKNALTYPLIMIGMMLLVIIILITKVMPVFNQIFMQLGQEMTGISKGILVLGTVLSKYSLVFVIIFVAFIGFVIYLARTKKGNSLALKLGYKMSFTKKILDDISTCRLADGMYLAIKSGMTVEDGLEFSEKLFDNPSFKEKISKCRSLKEEGMDIADAFYKSGIFTGINARTISIACRTGKLDSAMEKMASEFEDEVDSKIISFISGIEPALVVILSIIVGIMLLSVMLPLFGIMSNL